MKVSIETIWSEGNVRVDENDISGLATSINRQGQLTPLNVVERANSNGGKYLLIAGHRRLAAMKSISMTDVEVVLNPSIETVADRLAAQFAENVERKDLSPFEQMQVALDLKAEGMTQAAVATELGMSKAQVSKAQKTAKTIGALDNAAEAIKLSEAALFSMTEAANEIDDIEDRDTILTNALTDVVGGNARTVTGAIAAAHREARNASTVERITPLYDRLVDDGVEFLQENPKRGEVIAQHGNYGDRFAGSLGFSIKQVEDHRGLECHAARMTSDYNGPQLIEWCTKPNGHKAKGKSEMKQASADAKHEQMMKDRAERKATKEAKQLRADAVKDTLASKWSQKDAVAIMRDVVRIPADAERVVAKALELDVPKSKYGDYPDYGSAIHTWIESLPYTRQAFAPIMILAAYTHIEDRAGKSFNDTFAS